MLLSKKFEKELLQFCSYASHLGYTVVDRTSGDLVNLSPSVLKSFTEPPRNKLNKFLIDLISAYIVRLGKQEIEQWYIKTIIKDFKNASSSKPDVKQTEIASDQRSKVQYEKNKTVKSVTPKESEAPKTIGFNIVKGSLVKVHVDVPDVLVRHDVLHTFLEVFQLRTREITLDEIVF
ncbi:hypothetical protein EBU95_05415 [bacterium]|nr:hypothetical protein [bacterium]